MGEGVWETRRYLYVIIHGHEHTRTHILVSIIIPPKGVQ
jgi:hypothetical protein